MRVIDADAHVDENEQTWEYLSEAERRFKPISFELSASEPAGPNDGRRHNLWLMGGNARLRRFRSDQATGTTRATRELLDVDARLRHMDELGIDVQVLYPTIFIEQVADKPAVELAICKSYNRWLADIWSQSNNRLRWACVLPTLAVDEALEQIEYSRKNGACAVYMRSIESSRLLNDPYFYPIYERAADLDMAIGVHIANGTPWMVDLLSQCEGGGTFWKFRLASVGAFHSVIMSGLPERFPALRMGFLEASAQWLPYVLKDLRRRLAARGRPLPDNPLREYRLYVSCQTDDDVPYLLQYAGEDHLVIGTDYGHNDQSTEIEALRNLGHSGDLDERAYRKITDDNARALYGL